MSARVVVTGAASGIGAATVAALRRRGAHVVGLDLEADEGAGIVACDVRDQAAVDRAVGEAVERLGGLDALVNNAGVGFAQSAGEPPDDKALAVIDVNLLGPWRVTAAALPALRAAHGRVINVASGLVHIASPFTPAYTASKRGVTAYSDTLRIEYGGEIDVTTVYPGYVRTPIHARSQEDGFALEGVVPPEPIETVAAAIVRAALDADPPRDVATTRRGAASYRLAHVSRRLTDRAVVASLRRLCRRGHFERSRMAREFVARMSA